MNLPRSFDTARLRGDDPDALAYSAKVLHALDPAEQDEPNDRAKTEVTGQVGDDPPPNSPIHSFYTNSSGVSVTVVFDGSNAYANEILIPTARCGQQIGTYTGGTSTEAAAMPSGDATGLLVETTGPSGGFETTYSAQADWGWVWYDNGATSGQADAQGPTTASVDISANGKQAKVSVGKFSWRGGATFCSQGATKETLQAVGQ